MEQLVRHLEKDKIRPISNKGRGGEGLEKRKGGKEEGRKSGKLDTMKDNINNFLYNLLSGERFSMNLALINIDKFSHKN